LSIASAPEGINNFVRAFWLHTEDRSQAHGPATASSAKKLTAQMNEAAKGAGPIAPTFEGIDDPFASRVSRTYCGKHAQDEAKRLDIFQKTSRKRGHFLSLPQLICH
jgi:hypothetical protein